MENLEIGQINIHEIIKHLPHRYPFILIDRIISGEKGKKLIAIKNVTMNEPFFQGHFPGFPVMPGVLIVEALAQASGILGILSYGNKEADELFLFAGVDNVRFKRQVIPGDQLTLEIDLIRYSRGIGRYKAVAKVEGKVAAEAEIMLIKGKQ